MNTISTRVRLAAVATIVVASGAIASPSTAQPLEAGVSATPSALILFDTSGSMEWLDRDDEFPLCLSTSSDYGVYATPCLDDSQCGVGLYCDENAGTCAFARSRYHQALEVLTGTIPDYYPVCDERLSDPDRIDQLPTSPQQGIRHSIACTRSSPSGLLSAECYRTPDGNVIAPPDFRQAADGLIDLYGEFIAFGFMPFDNFPDSATDASGMFSYGISGVSPTPGENPVTCSGGICWNLGGRRPGAGVEGATIPPIDPADDTTSRRQQINQSVQNSILNVVPYWATPIGAILEDALTFYEGGDGSDYSWYRATDPSGTDDDAYDYSRGLTDLYSECRPRYAILITDGLPTYFECVRRGWVTSFVPWLPGCEGYWYKNPEYYAEALYDAGIMVYVIGFNIDDVYPPTDPRSAVQRLGRIADAGGTDDVYFADGSRELLFQLGDILSQIARGTPSRTRPAQTNRLASGRYGQYRFDASFEIYEESKYWSGNLERVAYECVGGALQTTPSILDARALLDARPLDGTGARRIYTTSPEWHSCYFASGSEPDTSLFSATYVNSSDLLDANLGVTSAEVLDACAAFSPDVTACFDLFDGAVGFRDRLAESNAALQNQCLAKLSPTRAQDHYRLFGGASEEEAEVYLRWLRGETFTEMRATLANTLDRILPANFLFDPVTGTYVRDRLSSLGDIFHSAPAIAAPADPRVSNSEDYQAFVQRTAERQTMIYVGSNDGLLHAFDAETMQEEWAFLPSSFSPRIGEWIASGHTFMFDGSPVVEDIVIDRRIEDNEVTADWRTVLVSGYRGGGRGYVAMDVTDPEKPRFLWELDAELDPQLGLTYGEPALGTILLRDCVGPSETACERGVAILGGGVPPLNAQPGSRIGRVMYVVDLETGLVLRRFTEMVNTAGETVPLPSAISGAVAAFDGFAGTLVTRAFVGDQEGRLYRVDLSSGDPQTWQIDMFFDPAEEIDDAVNYGEVRFKPTIAPGRDYRAVVVYGMGNVDDLDDLGSDQNLVLSVTEQPEYDDDGLLIRVGGKLNWALELEPYEKLTARPRVFNRRAYFATFVPNSANLCEIGGARLYAYDFIGDYPLMVGPANDDRFTRYLTEDPTNEVVSSSNPLVDYWDSETRYPLTGDSVIPDNSIIFSLDIVETPSCVLDVDEPGGGPPDYSGQGAMAGGGEYELQIGVSSYNAPGAGGVAEATSDVISLDLPQPQSQVITTSWTLLLE